MAHGISRRGVLIGALGAGLALRACGGGGRRASAAADLSHPENDDLSAGQIEQRFADITDAYEMGQSFSDTDVEFVLRYGRPAPTGPAPLCLVDEVTGADQGVPFDLTCVMEASYRGSFTYNFTHTMQLRLGGLAWDQVRYEYDLALYGWISPIQFGDLMCGFGIVRLCHASVLDTFSEDVFDDTSNPDIRTYMTADELPAIIGAWHLEQRVTVCASDGREHVLTHAT